MAGGRRSVQMNTCVHLFLTSNYNKTKKMVQVGFNNYILTPGFNPGLINLEKLLKLAWESHT